MLRAALLVFLAALPARAEPISFHETLRIDGKDFRLPMTLFLAPEGETVIRLSLVGDQNVLAVEIKHAELLCRPVCHRGLAIQQQVIPT